MINSYFINLLYIHLHPLLTLCAEAVLTGRYGAKAPQDSATNNLLSGYLWLICSRREQNVVERVLKATVEQKLRDGERQTGVQPPRNGNNSSIINMLTLWKPLIIFLGRFSASKLLAAVVVMVAGFVDWKYVALRWHRWRWKPKMLSLCIQGHYGCEHQWQYM